MDDRLGDVCRTGATVGLSNRASSTAGQAGSGTQPGSAWRSEFEGALVMRNNRFEAARCVSIARRHWDVPIQIPLRPYQRFSRRIARQLEKLVARWARPALPGATGPVCRSDGNVVP